MFLIRNQNELCSLFENRPSIKINFLKVNTEYLIFIKIYFGIRWKKLQNIIIILFMKEIWQRGSKEISEREFKMNLEISSHCEVSIVPYYSIYLMFLDVRQIPWNNKVYSPMSFHRENINQNIYRILTIYNKKIYE